MAKNNLSISLGVKLDALKKGLDDAVKILDTKSSDAEQSAKEMADAINTQLQKIGNQSTMRGAIRQMENLAGQMHVMGMEGTKAFREVIKQTGDLKAKQADLKSMIDSFNPDAPFKALSKTLQAATGLFAGFQGAMALVGDQSKETQEMMVKLQGAMALAMSTDQIDNLKDAFKELSLVIEANPLIAVAAGFVAVAAAVYQVYDALDAQGKIEKSYQEIQKKTFDNSAKEISQLDTLTAIVQDETQSREKRQAALNALNRLYPDTFKNYNLEKVTNEEIAAAHDKVAQSIFRKAKVAAAEEMLTEIYKKQFEQAQKVADGNLSMLGTMMQLAGGGAAGLQFEIQKLGTYQKQAEAIQDMIKGLTDVKDLQQIASAPSTVTKTKVTETVKDFQRKDFSGLQGAGSPYKQMAVGFTEAAEAQTLLATNSEAATKALQKQAFWAKHVTIDSKAMADMLNNAIGDSLNNMADAMGRAMVTGENMAKALGQAFLTSIAGFMRMLGQMFIKLGLAKEGFEAAMIKPFGGVAAIAIGVGLVAASGAMTAAIMKSNAPKKFATGGIVGGSNFTGDRVPALVNSGEMILNKTQQMQLWKAANGTGSNGQPVFHIYNTFDERGIATLVRRGEKSLGRG